MASSYQNAVDFRRLPVELQEKLIALQTDGEGHFAFFTKPSLIWMAPIIAVVGWLIYVYSATQQPLWESWMPYMVGAVSVVLFPCAFYGLAKMILPRLARLRSGIIVTTDEFFKIRSNRVQFCNLKDIEALRFKEDPKELEIWIGGNEEITNVDDPEKGVKIDRLFDQWKKTAEAGIGPELAEAKYAFNRRNGTLLFAGGIVAAIVVGLLVARVSVALNRSFDDHQTWDLAEQSNSIEEFQKYKVRHPGGNHTGDADRKIQEQTAKIKDGYIARASKDASPDAIKAMTTLLTRVSERPDRTIYVKISEDRQLDNSVATELEQQAGSHVNNYEVSVPSNAAEYRKNKIFSDIQVMMNASLGRGVANLQLSDDPPADASLIEARLQIRPEKTIYRVFSFIDGRRETDLYAVASFTYQIDVHPGGSAEPYHFEYSGQPIQLGNNVYDRRDKDNYTFDKVYFSAVTDEFDKTFGQTFGFASRESQ